MNILSISENKGELIMGNKITGYTDLYVLLGNPVEHSKSPEMYNYTFDAVGIDSKYVALTSEEADMENTFAALKTMGIKGGNLTMPVKTKGAELADELTDSARLIGAVNNFKIEDGKIYGHNTDGKGFINNLLENGHEIKGKKIVVLGCGAAATAIIVQSVLDGASEISIFNLEDNFYQNGEKLVGKLSREFSDCVISIHRLSEEALLYEKIKMSDYLFDATKVGMAPLDNESLIKDLSVFHSGLVVSDTVYNPLETKLIQQAKASGVKAAYGGIGMLLYQGAAGFNFMTGQQMPVKDVKRDVYGL